jgi:hypothetical protein
MLIEAGLADPILKKNIVLCKAKKIQKVRINAISDLKQYLVLDLTDRIIQMK